MVDGDLILNRQGALQTIAFTPVLLPVSGSLNGDFGAPGHLNPAAKIYLLYLDTDVDFAWQGKGSRPGRFGVDFSRNLATNFEIHGELARIQHNTKPVVESSGRVRTATENVTSLLLGLRYLTEHDTTYIAEYYRNGTGYNEQEYGRFYRFASSAINTFEQTDIRTPLQQALTLGQGGYGRPAAGRELLGGGRGTDFGEKQLPNRLEAYARYYF